MPYKEILILLIYIPFLGLLIHSLLKAARKKEIGANGTIYKSGKNPVAFYVAVLAQIFFLCLCLWLIQDTVKGLLFKE